MWSIHKWICKCSIPSIHSYLHYFSHPIIFVCIYPFSHQFIHFAVIYLSTSFFFLSKHMSNLLCIYFYPFPFLGYFIPLTIHLFSSLSLCPSNDPSFHPFIISAHSQPSASTVSCIYVIFEYKVCSHIPLYFTSQTSPPFLHPFIHPGHQTSIHASIHPSFIHPSMLPISFLFSPPSLTHYLSKYQSIYFPIQISFHPSI